MIYKGQKEGKGSVFCQQSSPAGPSVSAPWLAKEFMLSCHTLCILMIESFTYLDH